MGFLEGLLYMLWRGFAIGVIISAPMGPVGILCVQRTLEKGRSTGFFTGVGAAISDLFYCLLTGFGLSLIEDFLKENQNVITLIGSIVLIFFGLYLFRSNPARSLKKPDANRISPQRNILNGFLFTVSNPLIIFLIIGLFARFNFQLPEINIWQYMVGYLFIIVGALSWWWVVSFFVDKVRSHFNLRSMWLINRIIGVVVMIFAVVGIFNALNSSAEAKSLPHSPLEPSVAESFYNSVRGFGDLAPDTLAPHAPLLLECSASDSLVRSLPLSEGSEFSILFRATDLHADGDRTYTYQDNQGRKRRATSPDWGILLKDRSHSLRISFHSQYHSLDELIPPMLRVSADYDGSVSNLEVKNDYDFTGENSFRLLRRDGTISLAGGPRHYAPLISKYIPEFEPDSVSFFVAPGGAVSLDFVSLSHPRSPAGVGERSPFGGVDAILSRLSHSADPLEAVWGIFDRQLEDKSLRMGGNYLLASLRLEDKYVLIYLDGAAKNPTQWSPGMIKATLSDTLFAGVYDVVWYDPAFSPLHGEIKAQLQDPDILVLHFPDHGGSTLRLRKIYGYGK